MPYYTQKFEKYQIRELGFEPRQNDPKSFVLPLHHSRSKPTEGIEPPSDDYKSTVIPLYYAGNIFYFS